MPCTQRGLWEKGMPNEGRSPQQGLDMGGQQQSYGLVQSFTALLKTILISPSFHTCPRAIA